MTTNRHPDPEPPMTPTPAITFAADLVPDADEAAVAVCTVIEARTGRQTCYRIEGGVVMIFLI